MCLFMRLKPSLVLFSLGVLFLVYVFVQFGVIKYYQYYIARKSPKPLIAAWTTMFGQPMFSRQELDKLGCGLSFCLYTFNRYYGQTANAILFHWRDLKPGDVPTNKPGYQKWVMLNYESPYHTSRNILNRFHNRLDWSATYRRDADFVSPYGKIRQRLYYDPLPAIPSPEEFSRKRPVAWMVGNCETASGRENLVKRLHFYIQVDIYGKCAKKFKSSMGKIHGTRERAYRYLAERYKFYLAFENSLCTDYATEKVFHALQAGMVPVVYGSANYTSILPPNSFIDVSQHIPLSRLAGHIIAASQNYTLYSKYHEWRRHYVVHQTEVTSQFVCDLCHRLRNEKNEPVKEEKRDWSQWWRKDIDCT